MPLPATEIAKLIHNHWRARILNAIEQETFLLRDLRNIEIDNMELAVTPKKIVKVKQPIEYPKMIY